MSQTLLPQVFAVLAPILNGVYLFPQLYKTFHSKKVRDLSIESIGLLLLNNLVWLIHGYFIMDLSLILSGIISLSLHLVLIAGYFHFRKRSSSRTRS